MSKDADVQFGEIALQNKLISKKQHAEAWQALKKLKRAYKGKKKKPRLVDVLVQRDFINGSQARSVENARVYRAARVQDKLYGRIALKSKFVKPKHIERGLEKQKQAYLDGDDLLRLNDYLLDKNILTEEQDGAIQEVLDGLDALDFMEGRKAKNASASAPDDDDDDDEEASDEDVEEFSLDDDEDDDDLEELDLDEDEDDDAADDDDDMDLDLDLDLDDDEEDGPTESLDEEEDLDDLDADIEEALSDIDEGDLDASGSSAGLDDSVPAPRGLSSDDLLDDLDADEMSGLDLGDGLGKLGESEDDEELGEDINLTSDEVNNASGKTSRRAPKSKKAPKKGKAPKKKSKFKGKAPQKKGAKKKPAKAVASDSDDLDIGSDIDIDLGDLDDDLDL